MAESAHLRLARPIHSQGRPASWNVLRMAGRSASMSLISNTVLAFSMSADAFAASVGKGASLRKPTLRDAARIGCVFGIVETLTPVIGWLLGLAASRVVASVDHWLAFGILGIIGGKMIWEGISGEKEEAPASSTVCRVTVLTAIGTSIDAMAVGATLAFLDSGIWLTAAMIGTATFLMTTTGVMAGHYIGRKGGKAAEILGGICLIAIGAMILHEHLNMPG